MDSEFDTEDFPFPRAVSRESFAEGTVGDFSPDEFLYKHHRFSALDDLHDELGKLLQQLDTELLNLVNNDYNDFISLGHSIDGGLDIINSIEIDLSSYEKQLLVEREKLSLSAKLVGSDVKFQYATFELKYKAQLLLLLDEQLTHFELVFSQANFSVKQVLSLFLIIHKLYAVVSGFDNVFLTTVLTPKVNRLRFEFHTVLDEQLTQSLRDASDLRVLQLLEAYTVIGEGAKALRLIKGEA
ncbi:hypothetical protein BABINDRAFT_161595 [Babjeviella inositovora NRRL Y-12698]|uniref:Conserved oligomeric Golgi complex subunit 2 n=1 Tax=Babjeviella inositovora NRRL Y-12698 TaxID=984486 RepID=A0A1E3QQH1_9ASCO|nr:uncharacterized protein BABINDRAFT_161595 [Babjeviella inositovora NRRL Y-12698]ODQ79929.1 hypothetical protein BABINDRAFT_161595 [Babjeviella inositovora NRRL Y-12698]